jgi:O-acetylhomoserine/O-acetylserine sulfhydrylase
LTTFQEKGYHYSRVANPTNTVLEERMANLEGGVGAVATASGQAATLAAILALAKSGDNFVVSTKLYGGTFYQVSGLSLHPAVPPCFDAHNHFSHQFRHFLPRIGITGKFVATNDPADFEALIDENTKVRLCSLGSLRGGKGLLTGFSSRRVFSSSL